MMNIKLATENRKETAQRLSEITGAEVRYTRAPRFAYEIGAYTIEKDGSITIAEGAGLQPLKTLAEEGLVEPFETEDENRISLTVEVPLAQHTGTSLRNLINLLYTREGLINKALGTSFRVDEGLTKALQDNACTLTTESLLGAVAAYESEHGKAIDGLSFTKERITFTGLPETDDAAKMRTFTILCAMMNKQALVQKRIQAKVVSDENEKYALRIWLTRLGMNGPEYKEARGVLMENLTGNSAFRTKAEEEKWKASQAKKREAAKAAGGSTEA